MRPTEAMKQEIKQLIKFNCLQKAIQYEIALQQTIKSRMYN